MVEVLKNATITTGAGVSTEVAQELFGQQSQRSVISITNLELAGGSTCYLCFGEEASANKGIPLQPGQPYLESIDAGYKPSNAKITVFCAAAINLAVHERVLIRGY